MPENEGKKTNNSAIASFILALLGAFLCLIIIGLPLGIICLILSVIFGIIALFKKQKLRAAILGLIISISILIYGVIVGRKLITSAVDFYNWFRETPEIFELRKDKDYTDQLKDELEDRLKDKYSDVDDIKFLDAWNDAFNEAKVLAVELAEQRGFLNNSMENNQEIIENNDKTETIPNSNSCESQGGEIFIIEDELVGEIKICRLSDGTEIEYSENNIDTMNTDMNDVVENSIEESLTESVE